MNPLVEERRHFVLEEDEENGLPTELDETLYSSSSLTESLLGTTAGQDKGESRALPHFNIPTREQIQASARRKRPGGFLTHWKLVVGGLLGLFVGAWLTSELASIGTRYGRNGPKMQVILMISDGMGPASETMARTFLEYLKSDGNSTENSLWAKLGSGFLDLEGPAGFGITPLDEMLVGLSRTRSSSSLVTDSAAGATAFSCGLKTYNGAIGVEPKGRTPCGTILEAAKRQGFSTGVVTTSRLTHATPASFYAHVVELELLGSVVDIALGGGSCFFLPNSTAGSCRTDDEDLLGIARTNGMTVLSGQAELNAWHDDDGHGNAGGVLGLFSSDHMSYELDRAQIPTLIEAEPSLKEMAKHALTHLEGMDSTEKKGFFLMIEGARIDMAGHNNDPSGHVGDILAYYETVKYVKEWVVEANKKTPTMLISVSDHETGGLALGLQLGKAYPEYAWYPDALLNATHSAEWLGARLAANESATREWTESYIIETGLGVGDHTPAEVDLVWKARGNAYRANRLLAHMLSRRTQVGWSTSGHSGVDVPLYAFGYNSTGLTGNVENVEVGEHIAHAMGLGLEVVTIELNKKLDWFKPGADQSTERTTHVKHYHGDF